MKSGPYHTLRASQLLTKKREETIVGCDKQENLAGKFQEALVDHYNNLGKEGLLSYSITGNDATSTISKFIAIGSSFADAEKLLRDAGFDVTKRPGPNVGGNRPDRFDVYAENHYLLGNSPLGFQNYIRIKLEPDSPQRYDLVKSSYCTIKMPAF